MKNCIYLASLSLLFAFGCVDNARSGHDGDEQAMADPGNGTGTGDSDAGYGEGTVGTQDVGVTEDASNGAGGTMGEGQMDGPALTDSGVPVRPPAPIYLGGDRPANYYLPYDYDPSVPMPILIGLHSFSGNSLWHNSYFGLSAITQRNGVLLITPDGRRNPDGFQFWSATDHCCDQYDQGDVDVDYLSDMIDEAMVHFNIDTQRIGVFGHSNGGFMGYRLACDISDRLTHVISFAGTTWADAASCGEVEPVSVLQIHGTWDAWARYLGQAAQVGDPVAMSDFPQCQEQHCAAETAQCTGNANCTGIWACMEACGWGQDDFACRNLCYESAELTAQIGWMDHWICLLGNGCFDNPTLPVAGYAGAEDTVERWVERNGCAEESTPGRPLDLVFTLPGVDTSVSIWSEDCVRDTEVQLWTIERGLHSPQFNPDFSETAIQWFMDTPRGD